MKEYKRYVVWLDYFNSTISRLEGRRIPLNKSVKDPTLQELREASTRTGYNAEAFVAKMPSRPFLASGYVSVEKKQGVKKAQTISEIAKALSSIRGERTTASKDQVKNLQKKH